MTMENSGKLLKLERIKKGMKQVSLARGICSTSYLSKIENGHTDASEEVINLLYERLGIDLSAYRSRENEEAYILELGAFLKEITLHKDHRAVKVKLGEIEQQSALFESEKYYYDYTLIVLRFYLALSDLQSSQYYLVYLEEEKENLSPKQLYSYYKNKGIYLYLTKDNKGSSQSFLKALDQTGETVIEEWDTADLHYMLGLVSIADDQISNAIEYSTMALSYFRDQFHFDRAIECYITLGIAHKRGANPEKALEMFSFANTLSEKFKLGEHKGVIYQNMGSLHSSLGNSEQAIENYIYSLKSKQNEETQLISILSIVKEYSKQKNSEKVIYWINKGYTLLENRRDDVTQKAYYHHFSFYKHIHQEKDIPEKLVKEAVEFFASINDLRHCYKYSIIMARTLHKSGKYKRSAHYYEQSLNYMQQKHQIHYWEDL